MQLHKEKRDLSSGLRVARKAANLSLAAAGAAVGRTRQTMAAWEREAGTAVPSALELSVLARLYGVTTDVLLGLAGHDDRPVSVALPEVRSLDEIIGTLPPSLRNRFSVLWQVFVRQAAPDAVTPAIISASL